MRRFLFIAMTFVFISASAFAQDGQREKLFNAESFSLENGMRVVVIPNHRVPVVTHMVWYDVGASDEEPGQSGLAHFVEHLMFKGTETIPPGEFSKTVRSLGGQDNAFTSQDYTAYFQSIAVDNLETVMEMEADRMRNLTFPPEEVDSERLVVLEERRQRTENDPTGYFFEQMRAALFPNHPYGTPVIGWLHEMEALTRDNVMEFYNKWYAPDNAILIVSGDMTAEKLKPVAERIYGGIEPFAVPANRHTEVPPLLATQTLKMHHPSIQQPSFVRMYRVPSLAQDKQASLALDLLRSIMSQGQNSRLYKSLVVEQKIATDAGLGYTSTARTDGTLHISATPAENITLGQLEHAIDEELRKLVREGVTQQELDEAVERLKDAYTFSRDSIMGPAMAFGQTLITGGSLEDVEYWAYDIQDITVEQINNVVRQYLNPDDINKRPYVSGYIMPPKPAEAIQAGQTPDQKEQVE